MSQFDWQIRIAQADDRDLLKSFECADPNISWQAEVQRFIQDQLVEWALDPHAAAADPRLLLAFHLPTRELFGVAAHERTTLLGGDGASFHATKLEVLAVAMSWKGRRLAGGERASDVLMSAVMADVSARVPPRDARVFAVIHEENYRSLALCKRHGLTEEMSRPAESYRRVVTQHRKR